MKYTPVTSFRRAAGAAVFREQGIVRSKPVPPSVDKWAVLRQLGSAGKQLGISHRNLAVLQALLSFHQGDVLGSSPAGFVVHPSNTSICERLNGMPCSTMRRHLAALVTAGLIARRDSPNGKRFVCRSPEHRDAFGFDLTPLADRFDEISGLAEAARSEEHALRRARRAVSLMSRDLTALTEFGRNVQPDQKVWDYLNEVARSTMRALRRKLSMDELTSFSASVADGLATAQETLTKSGSSEMSTKAANIEHHLQISDKDSFDNSSDESVQESDPARAEATARDHKAERSGAGGAADSSLRSTLTLSLVLETCQEIRKYATSPIESWRDLVKLSGTVRPMMGISSSAWWDACTVMGIENASVVLTVLLERFDKIRCPGGYLRSLTSKAQAGILSPLAMLRSLRGRQIA